MNSGDAGTQYKLATLHEEGIGCSVNYANAGVLYTLACNKSHAGAAPRITRMAAEGLGTKQSPAQAWAHAALARERGDNSTSDLLAKLDAELDEPAKAVAEKALADLRAAAAAKSSASQGEQNPVRKQ